MKRLRKFTRLVLGEFMCEQVLPFIFGVLIIAAAIGVFSIIGRIAVWLGVEPIETPAGTDVYSLVGIGVVSVAFLALTVIYLIALFIRWLRRKWHEAGKP